MPPWQQALLDWRTWWVGRHRHPPAMQEAFAAGWWHCERLGGWLPRTESEHMERSEVVGRAGDEWCGRQGGRAKLVAVFKAGWDAAVRHHQPRA